MKALRSVASKSKPMLARPMVIIEEEIRIPDTARAFAGFRAWSLSDKFPESGRIDYLAGTIEVDMSPEHLQNHGAPKSKLCAYIFNVVEANNLGQVFVDCTRLVHPAVGLSCEPDIVFVSLDALRSGRARYVASKADKMMEVEGAATLVVEVVSDSSVQKDLKRLPLLYAKAGVEELWLVDARGTKGSELRFDILHLHGGNWRHAPVDPNRFQISRVLTRSLRFRREPWELPGTWQYFVDELPASAPRRRRRAR